jgi:exonuclease III
VWESFVNNTDVQPRIDERNSTNLGELNESNNIFNLTYTNNTIPPHRGMAIACLNINSLIADIDELRIFISNAKIDILCVNETKFDPSINDREVYLAGYEIVRRDRNVNGRNGGRGGGGGYVCIYIRSNINYQVKDDLLSATLENLVVEIKKPRSKSVLVSTWYRPPD